MERGSDKHGRLVDEELKSRVEPAERAAPGAGETRVEEGRQEEGDEELLEPADPRVTAPPPSPGALSPDEVAARGEVARFVHSRVFPADRGAVLANARDNQAPGHILGLLERLPDGTTFDTFQDAWRALGGHTERRLDDPSAGE